jgi:transcriptional regulator with XRE-family HTH domain
MTQAIGNLVRTQRKERGLTQEQLGRLLGVSQVAVSEWETGKTTPHNHMVGLKRELGIEADEFLAAVVFDDPVVREIWGQTRLPQQARQALVTIYEQLLSASHGTYAIDIHD